MQKMTAAEAVAAGYAEFNGGDHYAFDVPDGMSTVTLRTSEGKRVTLAFMPYQSGGAPQCVDICYHDNGTTHKAKNGQQMPDFHVLHWSNVGQPKDGMVIDTRHKDAKPVHFITVLMDQS